jgi:signal transduction histidine kinase
LTAEGAAAVEHARLERLRHVHPELVVVAVGALALVAWLIDPDVQRRAAAHIGSLKANTAICFVLAGPRSGSCERDATAAGGRWSARRSPSVCSQIALATLAEYAVGNLGIDELLFQDRTAAQGRANQAGAWTAFESRFRRTCFNRCRSASTHSPSPRSIAASVDQILRASRHLLTLIEEVLDISRIEGSSACAARGWRWTG